MPALILFVVYATPIPNIGSAKPNDPPQPL